MPRSEEGWQRVVVSILDLTEQKNIKEALRTLERRNRILIEHSPAGIYYSDSSGNCIYHNHRYSDITGLSPEQGSGMEWADALHPEDRDEVLGLWTEAVTHGLPFRHDYRFLKGGAVSWVMAEAVPERDEEDRILGYVGTLSEITDRKLAERDLRRNEEHLRYLAQHDDLTGLPNRMLFNNRLEHALAESRRSNTLTAVLFLDLDRFKNINDSLGHEAGDQLLQQVSGRLKQSVREIDTVARFGGDEFAVILEAVEEVKNAAQVAGKILKCLQQPFKLVEQKVYVTASMGVALFPSDGKDGEGLMKAADVAMYRAKEKGRNTYQFYTADMNSRTRELLLLETELRQAIRNEQLVLHFQPQFNMKNTSLVGMEALVRWHHPEKGVVPPGISSPWPKKPVLSPPSESGF